MTMSGHSRIALGRVTAAVIFALLHMPLCASPLDSWITNGVVNAAWDRYAFDGTLYRTLDIGANSNDGVTAVNGSFANDRFGLSQCAYGGDATFKVTVPNINNVFAGSYILNGGYDLDATHYGDVRQTSKVVPVMTSYGMSYPVQVINRYFPVFAAASSGSETAAKLMAKRPYCHWHLVAPCATCLLSSFVFTKKRA